MGQELWLSEKQLPLLQQLGTQFVARSGMEDAVSGGILVGRPFGGVSVSWSPDLDHAIFPITNFRHKRVVGIELKTGQNALLLLCVYMPFYNSSRRAECLSETVDAISMLETIIEQHPHHKVIVGGDLNTELKGNSPFDQHWFNFMSRNKLASCDAQFPPDTITYHHQSLDQKKWNDHFLVSASMIGPDLNNYSVLHDGDNVSDHFPIIMSLSVDIQPHLEETIYQSSKSTLKWDKLTNEQLDNFTTRIQSAVEALPPPPVAIECANQCRCRNSNCLKSLQQEYDALISCLHKADSSLPRYKPGKEKDWWTEGLSELKNKSIEIHALWIREGRPHQGPIHVEHLRARAEYKRALRAAQRAPKQKAWDRLHTALTFTDTNSFWKSWRRLYNKNKSHLPSVVNGISSKEAIANSFMNSFRKNSTPNNKDNVRKLDARFDSEYAEYLVKHNESCDCKSVYISTLNVIDALSCMKNGKSADEDNISVEHLHHSPLNMLIRLTNLFNSMLRHSFVPKQFQSGFMIPIVKDNHGNLADLNNYRGITISPIISKLFEHVLKSVFFDHLSTSQYQFGFKKNNSTSHALHCLRETVNYYVNNGSRVYCSFLDASKAFDRLVHAGLFLKLIRRHIPLIFLELIMSWYSNLQCRVKWDNCFSESFSITAGVRQGGILSPDFYSIYVDDLLLRLETSGKGCYIQRIFAAAIFYADDMAILSPSIKGLEYLLNICGEYCAEWDICLNSKKSRNLYFGRRASISYTVTLNGNAVEWADEWVYLGITLRSSKSFNCSIVDRVKKFYRCTNAILRIDGRSNDMVLLRLIETHCVPLLTYAIEIVNVLNRDERRQLRVAYNSVFRKIFHYRWTESVTALQGFLQRPTWEQLVEKRRSGFVNRLLCSGPDSLARRLI